MRYTETIVVGMALAGAATQKAMECIDTSTTIGVAASMSAGLLSAGIVGVTGIATTMYYRRTTRV